MKRFLGVMGVSLALLGATSAWADRDDRGGPGGYDQRDDRHDERHDDRGPGRDDHGPGHGRWADEGGPHSFQAPAPYHRPRGFQEGHHWQAGERLPKSHRGRQYYVDYRQYNLQAPPPGHQWVRVDNDFVLTVIATGVVVDVLQDVLHQ